MNFLAAYLVRRLAEPESRAALGAAGGAIAALATGSINAQTFGTVIAGSAIAFLVGNPQK